MKQIGNISDYKHPGDMGPELGDECILCGKPRRLVGVFVPTADWRIRNHFPVGNLAYVLCDSHPWDEATEDDIEAVLAFECLADYRRRNQ